MAIRRLKEGLKELRNNAVYKRFESEISDTFKDLNELYDLIADYPFAADVKDKIFLINEKMKDLKIILKELDIDKKNNELFKDRIRKKLRDLSEKLNRTTSLVSIHEMLFNSLDDYENIKKKLNEIVTKEETIEELGDNIDAEEYDIKYEENKIDSLSNEIDVIYDMLERQYSATLEEINRQNSEIKSLRDYVRDNAEKIKEMEEQMGVVEQLKSHLNEIFGMSSKEKKNILKGLSEDSKKGHKKISQNAKKITAKKKEVKGSSASKKRSVSKVKKKETEEDFSLDKIESKFQKILDEINTRNEKEISDNSIATLLKDQGSSNSPAEINKTKKENKKQIENETKKEIENNSENKTRKVSKEDSNTDLKSDKNRSNAIQKKKSSQKSSKNTRELTHEQDIEKVIEEMKHTEALIKNYESVLDKISLPSLKSFYTKKINDLRQKLSILSNIVDAYKDSN